MSASPDPTTIEQAIAWHLRLNDADEGAWIEFAEWLSADPARNGIYEAVVDGDLQMLPLLGRATFPSGEDRDRAPQSSNDDDHVDADGTERARLPRWRWGALAASVAVAGFFGTQMLPTHDARYSIETSSGETKTVPLADGSEILLNGSTKIILDKNDTRSVELARGEARFSVKHDDAHSFTVVAGGKRLVDIGTVFNVVRTNQQLRVGVAEGAVRFEGTSRNIVLRAGDSLAADDRETIEVTQRPVASIGSWANGKLVYEQAPLEQVAGDLGRSVGISLELPQALRSRRFSGVIQTYGDREGLRARLEELIGEKIVAHGTHWSVELR
ncbi:FecR family protein [Sphingomonas sp. NFR04]|uniref:FecR family protein n=1 Tax=Sphingomonas sp. NFR04 TaxID=1566283 RepID=UPI0008E488B1|nr:FecR domain-containing protein [Sphingomonas sp. NFR04]SFJ46553.1 FecR family protein [Sphingomonas sp. NFR04]